VEVSGSRAPTGVDAEAGLLLGYEDGRAATLLISLRNRTPGMARIHGTKGWIEVPPRFHHPHHMVLQRTGAEPEVISRPPSGTGYSHELTEVTECLLDGRTESEVMPLDDTLTVQRILNGACESLGVYHYEAST
jgi:predicted dehydrogenase